MAWEEKCAESSSIDKYLSSLVDPSAVSSINSIINDVIISIEHLHCTDVALVLLIVSSMMSLIPFRLLI